MDTIQIDSLVKRFGDVIAVNDLSLSVGHHEIYGFLGPNGAGKTTTIRILSTLTNPTSGRVLVNGVDVVREPVRAKCQIGVVHQSYNLDPELTGTENLVIHGLLFDMPVRETRSRIEELLAFVDLGEHIDRKVNTYSGGLKRRLTIARALLHRPRVIILDEPTAGLDAFSRRRVWGLIRSMREMGSTVLITTHYIEEAEQLSDRVGIIDHGRLIAEDDPARLVSEVGTVAVERDDSDGLDARFFETREEAARYVALHPMNARIRDTNLEDVFIRLTGRRVKPPEQFVSKEDHLQETGDGGHTQAAHSHGAQDQGGHGHGSQGHGGHG
jgi:ABC-2 type transport system ATP-binding protein